MWCGQVLVTVVCVSREAVGNAVTIQFGNMIPEQFYASYRNDFLQVLHRKLNVRLNDVEIINVQPSASSLPRTGRTRRSTQPNNLDVLFAIRKSLDRFMSRKSLKRKVQKFADELEIQLGVRVLRVFSDMCTKATCATGTCLGSVVFDDADLVPVVVNGQSFVSARHFYTHQCVCLDGQYCQLPFWCIMRISSIVHSVQRLNSFTKVKKFSSSQLTHSNLEHSPLPDDSSSWLHINKSMAIYICGNMCSYWCFFLYEW